ncbi:hypothetical protein GCM10007276_20220 [Agaricicola taiwanensis]|uniref:Uncharacterized protein n=1 Tax=Agaricicola taiwanensis TaxID=591372 RepID=A0A8J3DU87_9RHOB|nr:hypothetical protein GCM10007276_20220 [Agaricicola taiwanensis]
MVEFELQIAAQKDTSFGGEAVGHAARETTDAGDGGDTQRQAGKEYAKARDTRA